MIDLAPAHKRGLSLKGPVLNAAGFLGFGGEYRGLADFAFLGAFVTNPVTAQARLPASGERALEIGAGGALIHTGLPNPGVRRVIEGHARQWAGLPCPVIVHVAATAPDEVAECVLALEKVEGVGGVELGLDDGHGSDEAEVLTGAAVSVGSLPVIVRVPYRAAVEAGLAAQKSGAVALTVCAPPRGTLLGEGEKPVTGRLIGPAYFPLALHAVRTVGARVSLPILACGGIHDAGSARAMLDAGAVAVQLDGQIWRDPGSLEAIAEGLTADGQ